MGKHREALLVEVALASGGKEYWIESNSTSLTAIAQRYHRTARLVARKPRPGEIGRLKAAGARFKSLKNGD